MTNIIDDEWHRDFEEAEQQLRRYGYGHIEQKDEEWWNEMATVLLEYADEHVYYPAEEEFRQIWREHVRVQVKKMRAILAQGAK